MGVLQYFFTKNFWTSDKLMINCCFYLCSGCPTKHDSSKTAWKLYLNFEFICDIQSSTYFHLYQSWKDNKFS